MLKKLNEVNTARDILSLDSELFSPYGRVVKGDFTDMFAPALTAVDLTGPAYLRDVESLHPLKSLADLNLTVFAGEEIQAGLCFGMNSMMNGMEYHRGSEVLVAVTDVVLILGREDEIVDNSWDSSLARCFYIEKGGAVELFDGTLHLAPCRVSSEPFCTVIILPRGTNMPLEERAPDSDPLYFMSNKWLLCHKDSPAVKKGGFIGITGDNIEIIAL